MDKVFPERQMDWSRRERVEMEGKNVFPTRWFIVIVIECNYTSWKWRNDFPLIVPWLLVLQPGLEVVFLTISFFNPNHDYCVAKTGFLFSRWSHFAPAYCRRVPQLCASSIKPLVSVGLPTSFSKVKAFVWLYYLHDSISGNRSTRRKTTDSHEKFWSSLGKRCLVLVWVVNGGTY